MRAKELYERLLEACATCYDGREAQQIARIMMHSLTGVEPITLLLEPDRQVEVGGVDRVLEELAAARPMQYILGEAEFCGFSFAVREGVLIPRPETEELVALIVRQSQRGARVLDVGTGSGAIAISLSKLIPESEVIAVDISPQALVIARANATKLDAQVEFVEADALQGVEKKVDAGVDIVVSNPPYIPQSEAAMMRSNVTAYEPHLALFVEDSDPLALYRAIAHSSLSLLKGGGALYFEVHESFAQGVCELLDSLGYKGAEVVSDINDKQRIVWARRS